MENSVLERINGVCDVQKLNIGELDSLASELRKAILDTSFKNGGHLAASMGTVDVILALAKIYDLENDKLIFDVGHQSYAYKILLRGVENFSTLREEGGESGYPDCKKGDNFIGGHAGNSFSAALGMAAARDRLNENYNIITFIGDASFFNGENLEALFVNENKPKKFIVIFNDNGMSISENLNGMYKFLSKMSLKKGYGRTKNFFNKLFGKNFIGRGLKRMKFAFKRTLSPAAAIEITGMKYYGVFDGHNIKTLTTLLKGVKERGESAFIHIKTIKGKGYEPAEQCAEKYHGVTKGFSGSENTFSQSVSPILCKLADENKKLVAITAGMRSGTGLAGFAEKFPDRFFDVGISEEHAVTFAAGLAASGMLPIVCIYSTFLQRAYDQIISDVCMQNLPVIFLLDRAGMVGSDGRTHQGLFDLSYLKTIPDLTLLAPKDCEELKLMVTYALKSRSPVAIRYPNGLNEPVIDILPFSSFGQWETLKEGNKVYLLAEGPRLLKLAMQVANEYAENEIAVVNARSIKPLDTDFLEKIDGKPIITLEENVLSGGFGESVAGYYCRNGKNKLSVKMLGVDDCFVNQGTIARQLYTSGLNDEKLKATIDDLLNKNN